MHKKVKIDRPDWCEIGVRVKAWSNTNIPVKTHEGVIVGYYPNTNYPFGVFVDGNSILNWTSHAEPIQQWKPEAGETVACWGPSLAEISIERYDCDRCTIDNRGLRGEWTFIARIPDTWKDDGYPLGAAYWQKQEMYEED